MIEEHDATLVAKEVEEAAKRLRWQNERILTEDEMVEQAKDIAFACNWMWLEPTEVIKHLAFGFGGIKWIEVRSNANCRGVNVQVYFHPKTTEVMSASYTKR